MKIFKQINKITPRRGDIYLGFRKAYDISLLPRRVELIYTSYVIRILRVIGGFCMVLVLTGKYSLFVKELHILIFIAALLQSILISIIFIIKFVYGLYIIIKKPEIFEVRNSPLNSFSTLLARALTCAKWGKLFILLSISVFLFFIFIPYIYPLLKYTYSVLNNYFIYVKVFTFLAILLSIIFFIMELRIIDKFSKLNNKPLFPRFIPKFIKNWLYLLYSISKFTPLEKTIIVNHTIKTILFLIILFLILIIIFLLS